MGLASRPWLVLIIKMRYVQGALGPVGSARSVGRQPGRLLGRGLLIWVLRPIEVSLKSEGSSDEEKFSRGLDMV